jgi:hypothetical protein
MRQPPALVPLARSGPKTASTLLQRTSFAGREADCPRRIIAARGRIAHFVGGAFVTPIGKSAFGSSGLSSASRNGLDARPEASPRPPVSTAINTARPAGSPLV